MDDSMADSDLKELRDLASDMSILYVEDNEALNKQASMIFKKFFKNVYSAYTGKQGLALFKEHEPKIVITDIRMPDMDGLTMAKQIHKMQPNTKIMIASAFDDKEYLFEAINVGIFRYFKKPINMKELSTTLLDGIKQIKAEEENTIFANSNELLDDPNLFSILIYNHEVKVASQGFFQFFGVDNVDEFTQEYKELGDCFLEHKNFLYNQEHLNWFDQAYRSEKNFFMSKFFQNEKTHITTLSSKWFLLKIETSIF